MEKLIKSPKSGTVYSQYTRYNRSTIYIDPSTRKQFFALWKYSKIPESNSDIMYKVTPGTAYRADLISYNFYDTPFLNWIICIVNEIKNPLDKEEGLYSGRLIRIPDLNVLMSMVVG